MNIFELSAKITADTSDFDSKVGSMVSSGVKKFAALTTVAAGATTAFVGKAVSTGADFDKAMSQVGATMLKTNEEMREEVGKSSSAYGDFTGNLREFAQFLGENTVFSATQAAEALNFMALAGYNTQESMDMLPNVLSLAAAGGFDLARASDMVTDTQTAFGISAERTTQMVDEMAKAASTGNTSVEQLGDAFLTVGGLAKELNGGMVTLADGTQKPVDGLQELEIALTAMANAGVKGGEAGTHMRNMLLKLASPTKQGMEAFEMLGVSVFDTEGNMRSLKDVFGDLNASMTDLTQEEKLQAISDIFNTRDTASAEALLAAIAQDWDDIGVEILDAEGAAADMSKIQLDNLSGDITLAKSAFEGLQIAISDEVTPSLRGFVQKGTEWIQKLTNWVKNGGLRQAINALREAWDKIKDAISPLTNKLKEVFSAMASGNGISKTFSSIIDAIAGALKIIAKVLATVIDGISKFIKWLTSGSKSAEVFKTVIVAVVSGITALIAVIKGIMIVQKVIGMIQALSTVFSFLAANPIVLVIAAIVALVTALVYLYNHNEKFREKVQAIWAAITGFFEKAAEIIKAVWEAVVEFFKNAWENIKNVFSTVAEFFSGVWEGIKGAFSKVGDWFHEKFTDAKENAQNAWEGTKEFFSGTWDKIKEAYKGADSWLGDKFGSGWTAVKDAWSKSTGYFKNIWETIKGIFGVVKSVFTGDFQGAWDGIKNIVNMWTGYFRGIWDSIRNVFSGVTNWFGSVFSSASTAIRNAFSNIGSFFRSLWNSIVNTISGIVNSIINYFKQAWNNLRNIDWSSIGSNIISGIVNGINQFGHYIWDTLHNWAASAWNNVKSFFRIGSPSKLMRDTIGKWIPLGVAEGIEDEGDSVANALENVMNPDNMDLNYNIQPSYGIGNNVEPIRSRQDQITPIEINIYPTEHQDAKDIAREVERYLTDWQRQRNTVFA